MPINHPPFFSVYESNFSEDQNVEAMDTEEVGAHFLLLLKAWTQDPPGTIPNNDKLLCGWARVTRAKWSNIKDSVLSAWALENDRWHLQWMEKEYNDANERRKLRSAAGKFGQQARWGRVKDLSDKGLPAPPLERKGQGLILEQWAQMKSYFDDQCLACGDTDQVEPTLIFPELGSTIENTQPLCRLCFFGMDYERVDLRIGKCDPQMARFWNVPDPPEVKSNGHISKVREAKFELDINWHPSEKRKGWISLNYPAVSSKRVEEIRLEFIGFWTTPEKRGARRSQRSWDQTFGNRLNSLRDYGRLYRKTTPQDLMDEVNEEVERLKRAR